MLTIATHSGTFHADESLAIFMLKQLPLYKDAKIIRTRDQSLIEKADIVVDVGATYDPSTNRFDHHQRQFNETFSKGYEIKLSSAGLVYKHFGKQVIANLLNWPMDKSELEFVYEKVYKDLILMFDGVDNGVERYPSTVKAAYGDETSIAARVGRLNPRWNEPTNEDILYKQFEKAIEIAGEELVHKVNSIAHSWLPAHGIVKEAFENRFQVHESGKIIVLSQYCPWASHLYDLEQQNNVSDLPLYVLFEDSSKQWRIQAIAVEPGSFATRKGLPEPWRGIRDEQLSALTQVPDCVFVHASGFIGGAKTRDSILLLAKKALAFE